MSDFHVIRLDNNERKICASDLNIIHSQHIDFIKIMCEKYNDKKIVVVTHHAPSKQSIHHKFKRSTLNPAFVNDLDDFIIERPQIKYWIHGHTHSRLQYNIGNTIVCANPAGYRNEMYNSDDELKFDPLACIEI